MSFAKSLSIHRDIEIVKTPTILSMARVRKRREK